MGRLRNKLATYLMILLIVSLPVSALYNPDQSRPMITPSPESYNGKVIVDNLGMSGIFMDGLGIVNMTSNFTYDPNNTFVTFDGMTFSLSELNSTKINVNYSSELNINLSQSLSVNIENSSQVFSIDLSGEPINNISELDVTRLNDTIYSSNSPNISQVVNNTYTGGELPEASGDKPSPVNSTPVNTNAQPFPDAPYGGVSSSQACNPNGGSCSCWGGCSTAECCSTTCEQYTCLDFGCYPSYPNECNGYCQSACSSGSSICCPSSGPAQYCCPDSMICNADGSCVNCNSNSDCPSDQYYCDGAEIRWADFFCSGGDCYYSSSLVQDCDQFDGWTCIDSNTRAYADYACDIQGSTILCDPTYSGQQSCSLCTGGTCYSTTTVTGYIKQNNDNSVVNAKVKLETCAGTQVAYDYTDSNGYYSITTGLGDYQLVLEWIGYRVVLTPCQTLYGNVNFDTVYLWSAMQGYIKNRAGVGQSGIILRYKDCGGSLIEEETTDSNGYYHVYAPYSDYMTLTMSIYGDEYTLISCSPVLFEANVNDIILETSFTGEIHNSRGGGISGLPVRFRNCFGTILSTDWTDSTGYFDVATDAGYLGLGFTYQGIDFNWFTCDGLWGSYSFSNPIVMDTTIYGYLKDLNNNPLQGYDIELYDCSDNLIASDSTSSSGFFYLYEDARWYKFVIDIGGGFKMTLTNQEGNECNFFYKDANLGTLNINPTVDCSILNYYCYQGYIKLTNCQWNPVSRACGCYFQECAFGCTDGAPTCDAASFGNIYIDVEDVYHNPIPNAKIYSDSLFQGYTDLLGKEDFQALYGYHEIEVRCPDNSFCTGWTYYVDGNEYLYAHCGCSAGEGDIDVNVYSQETFEGWDDGCDHATIEGAYVHVDDILKGTTDELGNKKVSGIPYGMRDVEVYAYLKDPDGNNVLYCDEQSINLDSGLETVTFYLDPDTTDHCDQNGNILANPQDFNSSDILSEPNFVCGGACIIGAVLLVAEIASWVWDIHDAGKCTIDEWGNQIGDCADEYFWLGTNFIPDGGLIPYAGKVIRWVDRGGHVARLGDNIIKASKPAWKYISKYGDDVAEFAMQYGSKASESMRVIIKHNEGVHRMVEILTQLSKAVVKWGKPFKFATRARIVGEDIKIGSKTISKATLKGMEESAVKGLIGEEMAEEYVKMALDNGDELIEYSLKQGSGEIVTDNFRFVWKPDGKNLEIFKKSGGPPVGEIDRLFVVNNKPLIVEAKNRVPGYNTRTEIVKLFDNMESSKMHPMRELAEAQGWGNPDFLLIAPKDTINDILSNPQTASKAKDLLKNENFAIDSFYQTSDEIAGEIKKAIK